MIQTLQVHGTDKKLYQMVAPLVMNPEVLRANNNYPFKTTDQYLWFIAVQGKTVVGFIPVEKRSHILIINNYYVAKGNTEVLQQLLTSTIEALGKECVLSAVVLEKDQPVFRKCGFVIEKEWKLYVKMRREK